MKTYPRFKVYEYFSKQNSLCKLCDCSMNVHDLDIDNIITDVGLICYSCLEEKKTVLSNFDNTLSLIDTNLNSIMKFNIDEEFRFQDPIFVPTDFSYVREANEQIDFEDEIDPEDKIESSWYHRAVIGDENRDIYDDGQDTDFDAVKEFWDRKHEQEEIEENQDFNAQILCHYEWYK